jgi:hypothetical protein
MKLSYVYVPGRTIYRVRDWHDNVTVRITFTSLRYSVTMLDNDSGNVLPVARVYARFTDALAYAGTLVR